jgi:predicted ATPase
MIQSLEIKNFKSIRDQKIELRNLNVLIGQNGAGKSNLISLFSFLKWLYRKELSEKIFISGGISKYTYGGSSENQISIRIEQLLEENRTEYYYCNLISDGERFVLSADEFSHPEGITKAGFIEGQPIYSSESILGKYTPFDIKNKPDFDQFELYHFHDTSKDASIKQLQDIEDVYHFHSDGRNLAPYLLFLKTREPNKYDKIINAVSIVYPLFKDFVLEESSYAKGKIILRWKEKWSDNVLDIRQMSDGLIRFICLSTLLNMPSNTLTPQTIIIDEPELGLHPLAIVILGELLAKASLERQIIVATQSPALIDHFTPEDILVVERAKSGETEFKRKTTEQLASWLEDYTLGELWLTNLIGGRP